jgi:hypothetical protein
MTLIVCTIVPTGVAMAGDSRTTSRDSRGQATVSTDYAEKIFQVGNCVAGTTGWAQFGGLSVAEHVARMRADHPGMALLSTASDAARQLGTYFQTKYLEAIALNPQVALKDGQTVVEFLVGGQDFTPPRWTAVRVIVRHQSVTPASQPSAAASTTQPAVGTTTPPSTAQVVETAVVDVSPPLPNPSALWAGMADCVRRLILGYDGARINVNPAMAQLLRGTAPIIPYPTFTLQDAANFCRFLVEMTIMMQKFQWGFSLDRGEFATVGGRVDVAVVDREGVRWLTERGVRDIPQLSGDPVG